MENAATAAAARGRRKPLSSCEERARRAFEKGLISSETFDRLMEIVAEAEASTSSVSVSPTEQQREKATARIAYPEREGSPPSANLARDVDDDVHLLRLRKMRRMGFELAIRARIAEKEEKEEEEATSMSTNANDDGETRSRLRDIRLLRLGEACLATYPPDEGGGSSTPLETATTKKDPNRDESEDVNDRKRWDARFKDLLRHRARHGTVDVPIRDGNLNGAKRQSLGYWTRRQRDLCRRGMLSEDRRLRLDGIGFAWSETEQPPQPSTACDANSEEACRRVDDLVERYRRKHASKSDGDAEVPLDTRSSVVGDFAAVPLRVSRGAVGTYVHEMTLAPPYSAPHGGDDDADENDGRPRTGHWSTDEHLAYLAGLRIHGTGRHSRFLDIVKTRTVTQIRSHEQKYFKLLRKARGRGEEFAYCCGVQVRTGSLEEGEGARPCAIVRRRK